MHPVEDGACTRDQIMSTFTEVRWQWRRTLTSGSDVICVFDWQRACYLGFQVNREARWARLRTARSTRLRTACGSRWATARDSTPISASWASRDAPRARSAVMTPRGTAVATNGAPVLESSRMGMGDREFPRAGRTRRRYLLRRAGQGVGRGLPPRKIRVRLWGMLLKHGGRTRALEVRSRETKRNKTD